MIPDWRADKRIRDDEARRTRNGQLAFIGFVVATFVLLLWGTAASVPDEAIRSTPRVVTR